MITGRTSPETNLFNCNTQLILAYFAGSFEFCFPPFVSQTGKLIYLNLSFHYAVSFDSFKKAIEKLNADDDVFPSKRVRFLLRVLGCRRVLLSCKVMCHPSHAF